MYKSYIIAFPSFKALTALYNLAVASKNFLWFYSLNLVASARMAFLVLTIPKYFFSSF